MKEFIGQTGFFWIMASPLIVLGFMNLQTLSGHVTEQDMKALLAIPRHAELRRHLN